MEKHFSIPSLDLLERRQGQCVRSNRALLYQPVGIFWDVEMASTQSKERITTGAKELFSAPGYAATTVDAICEKSELTKGRFYCFFDSKEDLRLAKAHRDPTRIPRAIRGFRLSLATLIAIPESDGRTRLGKPMAVEIFKSTRTRILSVESGIQK